MLHKTSGILLHSTNYTDTSIIIKVYTRDHGLQTYMISGVRGKRARNKASLLQPLNIAELVASGNEKSKIRRISEFTVHHPYSSIPYDIIKSSIALFINEILYRALKEDHPDEDLYDFLQNALLILDLKSGNCASYHLFFLIQLSRFLGFYPQGSLDPSHTIFDLSEGRFVSQAPSYGHFFPSHESRILDALIRTDFEHFHEVEMDRDARKRLLRGLVTFYQLHIPGFGEIRSLTVLEEVVG